MKIAFHIHTLTKGGAERAVVNLAKELSDAGNEVIIINSIKCDCEYEVPNCINRLILSSEDRLGNQFKRMVSLGFKLRKIIKEEKPDVVIAFISGSIVRAVIAAIGLPTRVIASVRNDPQFEYRGKLGKLVIRYIFPLVDGFVFQTKQAQAYFNSQIQEKSVVIRNSVNPVFYDIKRRPVKNRIVTCGRLDAQKNQQLLIDAFIKVKGVIVDSELYIYGKGPEYDSLLNKINQSNISDSCFLMGETSDVQSVMRTADIFVLSSDFEGMPNVLIESITAGVPSIATDCPCGGPKDIIISGENGVLVETGNLEELAKAMIDLLTNENSKKKYSENARKSADRFQPDLIISYWTKFIKNICS